MRPKYAIQQHYIIVGGNNYIRLGYPFRLDFFYLHVEQQGQLTNAQSAQRLSNESNLLFRLSHISCGISPCKLFPLSKSSPVRFVKNYDIMKKLD